MPLNRIKKSGYQKKTKQNKNNSRLRSKTHFAPPVALSKTTSNAFGYFVIDASLGVKVMVMVCEV